MTSFNKGFLSSTLLASAALLGGCGDTPSSKVDAALKEVNTACADTRNKMGCIVAANEAGKTFLQVAKIDQSVKDSLQKSCDVPNVPIPLGNGEDSLRDSVRLVVHSKAAIECLSTVFDEVPQDETNVKLNAGLARLDLVSNLTRRTP